VAGDRIRADAGRIGVRKAPSHRSMLRDCGAGAVRWNLPKRLDEISGLALSTDDRLFAHDDGNAASSTRIDWHRGRIVKGFALGDPPVKDDFEGIAIAGTDFYLVTSGGVLYRAPGERRHARTVRTHRHR
jgi:hypothetical protein